MRLPVPGLGHVALVPVVCFTELLNLPARILWQILANLHGTEIVLGVRILCSSGKSAAGDLRFQQAVVENFWATLDFRQRVRHSVCANVHFLGTVCVTMATAGDCGSQRKADSLA